MSDAHIDIEITTNPDGSATAAVIGEFDALACETVREALGPLQGDVVLVDLGGVTFMNSTALHCITQLHRAAAVAGGRLTITALSPVARRLIDISGLGRHLIADPGAN